MKRQMEKNIYQSSLAERPKRKSVHFCVHLTNRDKQYSGYIINISDRGVGMYITTKFPESTIDCTKESILSLEMKTPLGEFLSLQCKVKWMRIKEYPSQSLTTSMGMEVIDPPPGFVALFHSI